MYKKTINKWTNEKYFYVLNQRNKGLKLKEIAEEFGISVERTRQTILKAERIKLIENSKDPFDKLSTRTRNGLKSEGLNTIEEVKNHLKDFNLNGIPNLGAVSKQEVINWINGVN